MLLIRYSNSPSRPGNCLFTTQPPRAALRFVRLGASVTLWPTRNLCSVDGGPFGRMRIVPTRQGVYVKNVAANAAAGMASLCPKLSD
jgi:hypothetical protein